MSSLMYCLVVSLTYHSLHFPLILLPNSFYIILITPHRQQQDPLKHTEWNVIQLHNISPSEMADILFVTFSVTFAISSL